LVDDTVIHSRSCRALTHALVAAAILAAAVLVFAAPTQAATEGCTRPVRDLNKSFATLSIGGNRGQLSDEEIQQRQQRGGELYAAALKAHPQCAEDFKTLVTQLSAVARSKTTIKGTPFLGPIGWLWNTVYYRVFSGNDVMMALFGWALLLSPIILVVAIRWVMRGARQGLHKPYVPEHLRAEL
jgi:hypothetical protein